MHTHIFSYHAYHAVPEIAVRKMTTQDAFIVVASDGVFEFLTNQVSLSLDQSALVCPLSPLTRSFSLPWGTLDAAERA